MAHCRSLGFPGFPVKSCGFGQLMWFSLGRTTYAVAGESGEVGNPGTLGVCDFFIFRCSLRPESSQEHLPTSIAGVPSATLGTGSSTPRHKALCLR
jgi:hypothetical protein